MMNATALLEEENVNLDFNYLEGPVEQEKYPEEYNLAFHTRDDLSSIELPGKNNYTLEEIAWLDHALFLQTYKSNSLEVQQLTDQILEEIRINEQNLRNKRINEPLITKKTLEMILINLWIGYFYGQPIMFHLDKSKYIQPKRYKKIYVTYDRLQIVIKNMEELGYIEIRKGYFYNKEDNRNRITRMWATMKLFKNFLSSKDSEIPDFYEPDEPQDIIILRDKDKKGIDYKDNKKTRFMREPGLQRAIDKNKKPKVSPLGKLGNLISGLFSGGIIFKPVAVFATLALVIFAGIYAMQDISPNDPYAVEIILQGRTPIGLRGGQPEYKEFEVRSGGALESGDLFRFQFKIDDDAYVYVVFQDSSGDIQSIKKGIISGKTDIFLPDENNWYQLGENTGTEKLYLIASRDQINDFNSRVDDLKIKGIDSIEKVFPDSTVKRFVFEHR